MADFQTVDEALQAIDDDAASRAWKYLEDEMPATTKAIQFLVIKENWPAERVLKRIGKQYGITEERTRHKMKLVIEALVRERDQ